MRFKPFIELRWNGSTFQSKWLTFIKSFCQKIHSRCDRKYSHIMNRFTSILHLKHEYFPGDKKKEYQTALINHSEIGIVHTWKWRSDDLSSDSYRFNHIFMLVSKNQTFHKSIKRPCSWNFNAESRDQVDKHTHSNTRRAYGRKEQMNGAAKKHPLFNQIHASVYIYFALLVVCSTVRTFHAAATRENRNNIEET